MDQTPKTDFVEGLSHLLLQVTDLEASERFYCGLLGLHVKNRATFGGDRPFFSTREGVGITTLPSAPFPSPEQRNVEHVALWVTRIDELAARLRAAGYSVTGPKANEYGNALVVYDPDGNRIECIEKVTR